MMDRWKAVILNSKNKFIFYCFWCILDKINAGLVSRRDFCKNVKNLTVQKLLTGSVYPTLYIELGDNSYILLYIQLYI